VWWIDGDDDLDRSMVIEFRRQGAATWRPAAPAMRAHPALIVNGVPLGLNSWAASAMFLFPGEGYELRLTLIDPDGGGEVRTVATTTRPPLPDVFDGRARYVAPGNGGDRRGDPFSGAGCGRRAMWDVYVALAAAPFSFAAARSANRVLGRPTHAVVDGATIAVVTWRIRPTISGGGRGLTIRAGVGRRPAQRDIVIRHNRIVDVNDGGEPGRTRRGAPGRLRQPHPGRSHGRSGIHQAGIGSRARVTWFA
jgi:hypothetical protein